MVEDKQKQSELNTRQYSVYITDNKKTSCGSGLLYYPGYGDLLYVFTCAHVLDGMETVDLWVLIPEKPENDQYSEYKFTVPASQIAYYPHDQVAENAAGEKAHLYDVAVIPVKKPEHLHIPRSEYLIAEAHNGDKVYTQGFPGGRNEGEYLLEALDVANATVYCNVPQNTKFTLRMIDGFIDPADREYEMEGFSGSSVWNCKDETLCSFGLLSEGFRKIYRSKLNAVKIEYIRIIMKNKFNVLMESKIPCIPEAEVAESGEQFDGALTGVSESLFHSKDWADGQVEKIRALIDDLKMRRAIDLCKQTISAPQFIKCNTDTQKRIMQHLLYCYEICQLEEEFIGLEKEMNRRGLLDGYDPVRRMTKLFTNREYGKAQKFAEEVLADNPDNQIAKLFAVICKVYTEGAGEAETVRQFLDDKERLIISVWEKDTQSLIYQAIGFVYSTHFHSHERGVRCLNRAYRINSDKVVLETLAMAYYLLAIKDAVDKDDKIIPENIDRESLFKARECYLIVLEKADELFLKGTIRLAGLPLYNTFVFSQDYYRVLTLYPMLIKYLPFSNDAQLRDVEMKYAKIRCLEGNIDFSTFKAITKTDKILLSTMSDINLCKKEFEHVYTGSQITDELKILLVTTIKKAEKNLEFFNERERLAFRIQLIHLYGKCITLLGWNGIPEVKRHYGYILNSGNEKLIAAMNNFIFELEHSYEETAEIFQRSFQDNPSIETWAELRDFHIRHGRSDIANALYKELFSNYPQIYEKEPEFAFRSYIEFIVSNRLDIKDALQCFLETKAKFHDADIADFLELELMLCTSTFNNPERFESERLSFVERGLISKESYHLNALVAYMSNLNAEKAKGHFESLNIVLGPQLPQECVHYLVWQREICPRTNRQWNGLVPEKIESVIESYKKESWNGADSIVHGRKFMIDRSLALDAWALYLLAENGELDSLNTLDGIYVSHPTINRIMFELCNFPNSALHTVLDYLQTSKHVHIQSADFEHQMIIRNKAPFDEPASTVAIAKESGCFAVIGEPVLSSDLIKSFANIIIRPCDLNKILSEL